MKHYKTDFMWRLSYTGTYGFSEDDNWEQEGKGSWKCSACGAVKAGTRQLDVVVQNRSYSSDYGSLPYTKGLSIVSVKFIELVGFELVSRLFHIGRVEHDDRSVFAKFRSLVPKSPSVIKRAGPESDGHICPKCRYIYYCPGNEQYLIRPKKLDAILHGAVTGMFFRDDIYQKNLAGIKLRGVRFEKIPLRDSPLDGLPKDLTTLRAGKFRGKYR